VRPKPPALLALAALGGTAILVTISIVYTPVPNLARDEALLTLFYAAVFAVPALICGRSARGPPPPLTASHQGRFSLDGVRRCAYSRSSQ
jgi:hypothetical protein